MRKIRLKPTESYCQKYLYTKIMTSKCKIIKYKLNANIFFQIYFCSTFSVRIQKVKINWKGRRLFERRHSKNTIWCESTHYWLMFCIKLLFEVHWINSHLFKFITDGLYKMSFNDMIYTKYLDRVPGKTPSRREKPVKGPLWKSQVKYSKLSKIFSIKYLM